MDKMNKKYKVSNFTLTTDDEVVIRLKYIESCYYVNSRENGPYVNIHTTSGANYMLQRVSDYSEGSAIVADILGILDTSRF